MIIETVSKSIIAALLCGSLISAQSGKQVVLQLLCTSIPASVRCGGPHFLDTKIFAMIWIVGKLIIASILCGSLLPAQAIKRIVPPISVHQYSSLSPLSVNKDKLHIFDLRGHARIVKLSNAAVIADPAPNPEAHWDNVDNDLMWLITTGKRSGPRTSTRSDRS